MPQPVGQPVLVSDIRQIIKDFGTCLNFTGGGQIDLGTNNIFDGDFYWSGRIKWYGENSAYQHIFAKRDSYASDGMMFDLHLNNTTGILSFDSNVSNVSFGQKLPKNRWVHLVWVHNVTDSLEQIYINADRFYNGEIKALGTGTDALVSIGSVESGASEPLNGLIDEVAIGNSAPSWEDVVAMYAKYKYPSLWTYLKLDEGSGTTATDSSGNENDGTITTAVYATDKIMTTRTSVTNRFSLAQASQKSLLFGGTGIYATVPIIPDISGFSLGFWVKLNDNATNTHFLNWQSAANTDGFIIFAGSPSNTLAFRSYNSNTLTSSVSFFPNYVKRYTWIFVAVTWKVNSAKIYSNSLLQGVEDTNCDMTISSDKLLTIGKHAYASSGYIKMNMKNFTFQNVSEEYPNPWTQAQIDDLYYRNTIPEGALQWSMNDVATDQNGENALTLTGTSYSTNVPPHMNARVAV